MPAHDAVEHAGGWSDFVESRELARRQQHEGYEKYTAERDRLQSRQQTQREWAVTGVKNAKKKKTDNDKFIPHLKSQRSEKMAAKVKATEKAIEQIGRAHVWTPVTNAHLVCRLLIEQKKPQT